MFFLLLYLVQAGLFFTIPLYLSVSLGLTALETGVRILPLSITLLIAALTVLTLIAGAGVFYARRIPTRPQKSTSD